MHPIKPERSVSSDVLIPRLPLPKSGDSLCRLIVLWIFADLAHGGEDAGRPWHRGHLRLHAIKAMRGDKWRLDEMVAKINGRVHWL